MESENILTSKFWWLIGIIGFLIMIYGMGTFTYQCIIWLRDGYFPHWEFYLAFKLYGAGDISTGWIGLNRIIQWIMEMPLSAGLVLSGMLVALFGTAKAASAETRERTARLKAKKLKSKSPSME